MCLRSGFLVFEAFSSLFLLFVLFELFVATFESIQVVFAKTYRTRFLRGQNIVPGVCAKEIPCKANLLGSTVNAHDL